MARLYLFVFLLCVSTFLVAQVETIIPDQTIFCLYFCGIEQFQELQQATETDAWKHPEVKEARQMLNEVHQAIFKQIQTMPKGDQFVQIATQLASLFKNEAAFVVLPVESQLGFALIFRENRDVVCQVGTASQFKIQEQTANNMKMDAWEYQDTKLVGCPVGNCYILTMDAKILQTVKNAKKTLAQNSEFQQLKTMAGNPETQAIYAYLNAQSFIKAAAANPNMIPGAQEILQDLSSNVKLWGIQNWKGLFFTIEPGNMAKINLIVWNPGKPEGLFELLDVKGGNPQHFNSHLVAPVQEASYIYLDLLTLWQKIKAFGNKIDPDECQKALAELDQLQEKIGYNIENDILSTFSGEMMSVKFGKELPGISLMLIRLRDVEKFNILLNRLNQLQKLERREIVYKNQTIHYLVIPTGNLLQNIQNRYEPNPIALAQYYLNANLGFNPCFYIQGDTIVISNLVQNLTSYLDYKETHPTPVALPISIDENTPMVSWQDASATSLYWYNTFLPLLSFAEGPLREIGIPWDNSKLPRAAATKDLFSVSHSTWNINDQGIHIKSQLGYQIIGPQMTIGVVGVAAALALPALSSAQNKAKMVRCQSNLKQIGMAVSMYEAEYGKMPPLKNPEFFTELYNKGLLESPSVFISPMSNNTPGTPEDFVNNNPDVTDYCVRTTQPLDEPLQILIWSKPYIHPDGRTVLFMDGHVEFVPEYEFHEMLQAIGEEE